MELKPGMQVTPKEEWPEYTLNKNYILDNNLSIIDDNGDVRPSLGNDLEYKIEYYAKYFDVVQIPTKYAVKVNNEREFEAAKAEMKRRGWKALTETWDISFFDHVALHDKYFGFNANIFEGAKEYTVLPFDSAFASLFNIELPKPPITVHIDPDITATYYNEESNGHYWKLNKPSALLTRNEIEQMHEAMNGR